MKWIQKKNEPQRLKEWRSCNNTDINYGYDLLRQDREATEELTSLLVREQGWLCAYTGIGIDVDKCHIEHVKPQTHCTSDEAVSYSNLVACYPPPNQRKYTPYGAVKKDKWPDDSERHLFVSPLEKSCENRFRFKTTGEVEASDKKDVAAKTTIQKLELNHRYLKLERRSRIRGTLGKNNTISLKDARRRLKSLDRQNGDRLDPFWFVLRQVLEKRIQTLEYISKSKASKGKPKSKRSQK